MRRWERLSHAQSKPYYDLDLVMVLLSPTDKIHKLRRIGGEIKLS